MTRNFKKRHRKELPAEIRSEIVRLYTEEHMHQRNIAELYKISKALVGRLVRESISQPEKQLKLLIKEQRTRETRKAIKEAA